MDDPAELLRRLGPDTIKQLEELLETEGMVLDVIFYREKETGSKKIWQPKI